MNRDRISYTLACERCNAGWECTALGEWDIVLRSCEICGEDDKVVFRGAYVRVVLTR